MSWTFITVTFIQDVYIFKKYSTQRQLLKTGRLLKTQEYAFTPTYPILTLYVDCSLNHLLKILLHSIFSSGKILKSHQQVCVLSQYY